MFFQERLFNVQQRIIRLIADGVIEMPDMIVPSIPRPIQFLNARFQLLTHGVDMAEEVKEPEYNVIIKLIGIDDNKITYRVESDLDNSEYYPDALVKVNEEGATEKQYYRDDVYWSRGNYVFQYVLDDTPQQDDDYRMGLLHRFSGPAFLLRLTYENLTQIGSVITWTPDVVYSLVSGCDPESENGAVVIKEVKNDSHAELRGMSAIEEKAAEMGDSKGWTEDLDAYTPIEFTSDENGISFIIPEYTTKLEFLFRDNNGEKGLFHFSPSMFTKGVEGMLFVFIEEWHGKVVGVLE